MGGGLTTGTIKRVWYSHDGVLHGMYDVGRGAMHTGPLQVRGVALEDLTGRHACSVDGGLWVLTKRAVGQ